MANAKPRHIRGTGHATNLRKVTRPFHEIAAGDRSELFYARDPLGNLPIDPIRERSPV